MTAGTFPRRDFGPRGRRFAALPALLALAGLWGCGTEDDAAEPCAGAGVICTYLGTGQARQGDNGVPPLEATLYQPQDIAFAPDGTPYVIDWNNHRIRAVIDGLVETVIGNGEVGEVSEGPALEVYLNHPTHASFDEQGRVYLAAWHNSRVMRYDPATGLLERLCGDGARAYAGDGGPASMAKLDLPVATALDSRGRLLIMDQANQRVRRIEEDETINTIVGPDASFQPVPAGYERVCATNAEGVETCKLCLPEQATDPACEPKRPQGFAGDGGPATDAAIYLPFGQFAVPNGRLVVGPDDTIYFADTGNHRIRAVDADGMISTVAGSGPEEYDPDFAGGYAGDGGPALEALLMGPTDIALGPDGSLYIADTDNSCVRRVDPDGDIDTVAGVCGEIGYEGDGGAPDEALLNRPYGVEVDADGALYISDTHNNVIRVVVPE